MTTTIEYNNALLEEIEINVTELCDAIHDADLGIVTSAASEYHVCELRGRKFQSWHELAEHCQLDIMDFASTL